MDILYSILLNAAIAHIIGGYLIFLILNFFKYYNKEKIQKFPVLEKYEIFGKHSTGKFIIEDSGDLFYVYKILSVRFKIFYYNFFVVLEQKFSKQDDAINYVVKEQDIKINTKSYKL